MRLLGHIIAIPIEPGRACAAIELDEWLGNIFMIEIDTISTDFKVWMQCDAA